MASVRHPRKTTDITTYNYSLTCSSDPKNITQELETVIAKSYSSCSTARTSGILQLPRFRAGQAELEAVATKNRLCLQHEQRAKSAAHAWLLLQLCPPLGLRRRLLPRRDYYATANMPANGFVFSGYLLQFARIRLCKTRKTVITLKALCSVLIGVCS